LQCGIKGAFGVPYVPAVSRIVGRYEILDKLGEGGMADVYLARQLDLDRLVALKELRALSGADPAFAKRFLREARMAGSLSHPNIVTVHDYIESDGTPFIAMEYMERGSLRPWIGRMSLAQIAGTLEGVLGALDYAGGRGIVHRDVKPENVMIGSDGRVKIADFGIAKASYAFQTSGQLTADGTALGTPNYMAPEQASAEEVGPWTDIYAAGVMSFEMFVGRPPFADTPSPLVVIMRQVRDPIPLVTDLDPRIDPRIAQWIAWLTAKDPSQRPRSAGVAWDRFEEIVVSILGSRWQRGARLLPSAAEATAATPLSQQPTRLRTGVPVAAVASSSYATPPTQPLGDPRLAATVPANPDLLGIDRTDALGAPPVNGTLAADGEQRHRRRRRAIVAAIAAALLLAVVAAAALRQDSPPVRAAQAPPAHKAKTSPSPAASALPKSNTPAGDPAAVSSSSTDLSTQARSADGLAHQYREAAAKIEGLQASGSGADQNGLLADLTRKTADAYGRAADSARRGDAQGYATNLAAALAAKSELDSAARTPAPAATPAPHRQSQSPSACAGDSVSDDPSDDSCGGGEP
jgi:serine/threonine protein kinase